MKKRQRICAMVLTMILLGTGILGGRSSGAVLVAEAAEIITVDSFESFCAVYPPEDDMEIQLTEDIACSQLEVPTGALNCNVTIDLNGHAFQGISADLFQVTDGGSLNFVNTSADYSGVLIRDNYTMAESIKVSGNGSVSIGSNIDIYDGDMAGFQIIAENGGSITVNDETYQSTESERIIVVGKETLLREGTFNDKLKVTFFNIQGQSEDKMEDYYLEDYFIRSCLGEREVPYLEFNAQSFPEETKNVLIGSSLVESNIERIIFDESLGGDVTLLNSSSMEVQSATGTIPNNLYSQLSLYGDMFSASSSTEPYLWNDIEFVKAGDPVTVYSLEEGVLYNVECGNTSRGTMMDQREILPKPDGTHVFLMPSYAVDYLDARMGVAVGATKGVDYEVAYKDAQKVLEPNASFYSAPIVIRPIKEGYKIATPGAVEWSEELVITKEGISEEQQFVLVDLNVVDVESPQETSTYGMISSGRETYSLNLPPVIKEVVDSSNGKPVRGDIVLTVNAEDSFQVGSLEYSFDGGQTWGTSNTKTYSEGVTLPANTVLVRDSQSADTGSVVGYEEEITLKIDYEGPEILVEGELFEEKENGNSYNSTVNISFTDLCETVDGSLYEGFVMDTEGVTPIETGESFTVYQKEESADYTVVATDELGNETKLFFSLEKYTHELMTSGGSVDAIAYKEPIEWKVLLENTGDEKIVVSAIEIASSAEAFAKVELEQTIELESGGKKEITVSIPEELLPGDYGFALSCNYTNAENINKVYRTNGNFSIKKAQGAATINCESIYLGQDIDAYIRNCIKTEDYDSQEMQIYYKGAEMSEESYTQEPPETIGDYTVKVVFSENKGYETLTITGSFFIILRDVTEEMYEIKGTMGENGWYTSEVMIVPADNYAFADGSTGYTIKESGSVSFSMVLPDGTKTKECSVSVSIDTSAPEIGENEGIIIEDSLWQKFLNVITFGIYKGKIAKVDVVAHDKESDVTYGYYISEKALTMEEAIAAKYTAGNTFSINTEGPVVIYACIENKAGLCTYISSDGMIFDMTKPVISGAVDGAIYDGKIEVTITDNNLWKVNLNGVEQKIIDGAVSLVLEPGEQEKTYTIQGIDMSGLETNCSFTIKAKVVEKESPSEEVVEKTEEEVVEKTEEKVVEKTEEKTEEITEEKVVITGGRMALETGKDYWLESGTWKISGDKTIYMGGQNIQVMESGEFEFEKVE